MKAILIACLLSVVAARSPAPIEQQNDVMAMIGGAPTVTASTALHAVALLAVSDPAFPTRGHFGGGCIVSRNRVVTAAHVVANAESVTAWFFDGAVDLASRMSTNSIWIQIMMGFDAETRENDVAIVMFPANVFSLANVIPVTSLAAPTGGAASLAGFGFTTPDATEPNELPLLADHTVQACASDLEAQSTHFCALAAAATFVCPGDNGNGLWTEEGTVKSLRGVLSLMETSCSTAHESVFTDLGDAHIQAFLKSQGIEPV